MSNRLLTILAEMLSHDSAANWCARMDNGTNETACAVNISCSQCPFCNRENLEKTKAKLIEASQVLLDN